MDEAAMNCARLRSIWASRHMRAGQCSLPWVTRVYFGVTIEEMCPADEGARLTGGWLSAEYSMLPYRPAAKTT